VLERCEEKKEQTQETGLKVGHYIIQRRTLSRSCLQRKSGGKPPHSKMLGRMAPAWTRRTVEA
jgi:hypothetical protein